MLRRMYSRKNKAKKKSNTFVSIKYTIDMRATRHMFKFAVCIIADREAMLCMNIGQEK